MAEDKYESEDKEEVENATQIRTSVILKKSF